MKKLLWLWAAVGLAVAGCKTMEPRPEPPPCPDCSAPPGGAVPAPPPVVSVPDTGTVPALEKATQIIVAECREQGRYVAMGVDTEARRFSFLIKGGRMTREAAFTRFYQAGVPVTVYTSPVALTARGRQPAPEVPAPPPSPAPAPREDTGSTGSSDAVFDNCANISDDPPEPKTDPKGAVVDPPPGPSQLKLFSELAWRTAYALDAVSAPAPRSGGTVPR